jgi:signal transduction histidine kinase
VKALRTLRGRLVGGMLVILVLFVTASVVMNIGHRPGPTVAPENEPYQDALVLAGFTIAALILIWGVGWWSLRPLARASQEARAVGPLDPSARLSRSGLPAEITPLVDAVNAALDRMADAVAAERRFTENAAHELRTPLAVLGLRLQRARAADGGALDWPSIERDLAQMNRLVAQLLDLARKENAGRAGDSSQLPPINVSRLAREAAAMILPLAEAQGRSLVIEMPDALMVRGQADDLRDALRNVLENAALHGRGTISLHGEKTPDGARLRVSDEGPGIPPGREDAVFQRFEKDASSEGSGLGLAIVREVVRRHGGLVRIAPGSGAMVEITLPGCA